MPVTIDLFLIKKDSSKVQLQNSRFLKKEYVLKKFIHSKK
jgi:hypothetical protein